MTTETTDEKIDCVCAQCGAVRRVKPTPTGLPRTPKGWKNKTDGMTCAACQKQAFRIRAVEFTIAGIEEGGTWADFLAACKIAWAQAAAYKNTVVSLLWARDIRRTPALEKLPKMPALESGGVYKLVNQTGQHLEIDSGTRASLARSTEATYQKTRYELLWTMQRALPNFRYPQPYPVRKQETGLELGPDNQMLLSLRMGGQWWKIRLRGGAMQRSRTADFRLLASGQASLDELVLIRSLESKSNGGKTGTENDAKTGKKLTIGVRVKAVGWFPKTEVAPGVGTMTVSPALDAFVTVTLENDPEPWLLHGEHITRAIARHQRWLQVQNDDRKFERRRPNRARARYNAGTQARVFQHTAIAKNWLHESTRQVANFAIRRRVSIVRFEEQPSHLTSFPWFQWRTLLATKLAAAGITFIGPKEAAEEASVTDDTPSSLT